MIFNLAILLTMILVAGAAGGLTIITFEREARRVRPISVRTRAP